MHPNPSVADERVGLRRDRVLAQREGPGHLVEEDAPIRVEDEDNCGSIKSECEKQRCNITVQ